MAVVECDRGEALVRRNRAPEIRSNRDYHGSMPARFLPRRTYCGDIAFAEKFGRPAKGNDKGKVEGLVGYSRRNFMVPIPRAASWEPGLDCPESPAISQRFEGVYHKNPRNRSVLKFIGEW